jgi:OmpA-OmpF porin, OOP family
VVVLTLTASKLTPFIGSNTKPIRMKKTMLLIVPFLTISSWALNAQVDLNRVIKRTKEKTNQKIENRIENKLDKAVDKKLDEVEDGAKAKPKSSSDKTSSNTTNEQKQANNPNKPESSATDSNATKSSPTVVWNKFDFVPGDKIIFEDAPSMSERNGEFPSRWDLYMGQVEIMNVNGENVIGFLGGGPTIVPYLKDNDKDYLPDVFTVEFDIFRPAGGNRMFLYFHDRKNQKLMHQKELEINLNRAGYGDTYVEYKSGKSYDEGNWMHVSIAFTKGQLKVYLDENRLLNIPRIDANPTGISIRCPFASQADNTVWYMKNFRLAEGGVPYAQRALQDGKIIVTGIKFDVGKATLRPESMGPINEILYVMNQSPEIRFSVEGHTDSDGDDAANQTLSEGRAKAVMDKLIELGIDKSRLTSKGFGESKPIANNSSAEGKAQNRRVEFVKF